MRSLPVLVVAALVAAAQGPLVRLTNATRPTSNDFQIGDHFEIVITGRANQPVSVRTTMNGRTDWGPVIGRTDLIGRWSTTGQFEKSDLGHWTEVWTIGGKLANPVVHFSVSAPCLKGGQGLRRVLGPLRWPRPARPRRDAGRSQLHPQLNLFGRRMAELSLGSYDRT